MLFSGLIRTRTGTLTGSWTRATLASQTRFMAQDNKDRPKLTVDDMHWDQVPLNTSDRKTVFKWAPKGKYATIDDVPEYVSLHEMDHARSKQRIYTNLGFMLLGLFVAISSVAYGKYRENKGMETLEEYTIRKHKEAKDHDVQKSS